MGGTSCEFGLSKMFVVVVVGGVGCGGKFFVN